MMKLNISASNVYICYCHNINSCCTFNSLMVLDMLLWYWASHSSISIGQLRWSIDLYASPTNFRSLL